jgi:hypothetical protein
MYWQTLYIYNALLAEVLRIFALQSGGLYRGDADWSVEFQRRKELTSPSWMR